MARPKGTPVRIPEKGRHASTASRVSQEHVSVSSSGSDSDSHSTDSSSSQESSGTGTGQRVATAVLPQNRRVYEPPQGFQSLETDPSSSHASKLFDPSNLGGKQIWHIIAPASVPVNTLKEVSTQKVMDGEAVLSHNGSEYGFATLDGVSAGSSHTMLLVPGKEGYQPAGISFARTLHLKQVVKLPLLTNTLANTEGTSQASSELLPAKKAARKQPEGLKMRFIPTGVDSSRSTGIGWDSPDGSDMDGAEGTSANSFRFPNGFTKDQRLEKRKRESRNNGVGDAVALDVEPSPHKKRPKYKTDHKPHSTTDAPIDLATPKTPTPRRRTEDPHDPLSVLQPSSTIPTHDSSGRRRETSQERARRKEKERRRRERAERSQRDDRPQHSHRQKESSALG
ncbi:MAG: hypothetical protein M1839_007279 [Geoglossum umbratile]|nr:MAG: hypothetical protein M1839_007279 [Geoglossum umbratile]